MFGEWQHQVSGAYDGRREFLSRVHRLLSDASGEYDGDFVDPELKASKSLSEELSKRSVYVRGPLASFLTSIGISKTAAESGRDAFLLCLLEPPSSVAEKDCLPKARLALSAGPAAHQSSMNFHRLDELEAAAPYLSESWGNRIGKATDTATLSRLERELKKAPLSAAKQAAGAERLLVVVDEPNDLGGVTELDGEHAHSARVVMWDLTTGKAILRFRTKVDPEWITPNRRSQYARELDGCKLALTLRDFVVGVKVK